MCCNPRDSLPLRSSVGLNKSAALAVEEAPVVELGQLLAKASVEVVEVVEVAFGHRCCRPYWQPCHAHQKYRILTTGV